MSLLEIRAATKTFRGIPAITQVDLSLAHGSVHAIVGENGAGKSTLMKALAGVHPLTSGEILIENVPVTFSTPQQALASGIAMVFQETSLVGSMTVAQNIYLGEEKFFNRLRGLYISAQQLLQTMGFDIDPAALVSTLGAAQKQMVEVARAAHHRAKILILDEPTATLTPEERHHFFELLQRLKMQGVGILFITHALEEALTHADQLTVLRDGQRVAHGAAATFDRDQVIQAMVGRELHAALHGAHGQMQRKVRKPGTKVLSVLNVSKGTMVRNTSFSVYAGQITCMFGLVGAGRTETMKIVVGAMKRDLFDGGEIRFMGKPVRYRVPRQAVRDGIVYVTEDRKLDGYFETLSISENIFAGVLSLGWNPVAVVSMRRARRLADTWRETLRVRAINNHAKVVELSGGNQQKVVIAKALVQKPRLIVFDEPTRGVDVGAIAEIHQCIQQLADDGIAVVVISSYLPEVLALADRILVARQGQVVEEMSVAEATQARIMYAAVH